LAKTESELHLEAIDAPEWPVHFLQSLARYVYRTSNVFGSGDHMPLSKALGGGDSKITALLFANDPELKSELRNPFGQFSFIEIVGVTEDELEAAVAWNKKSFLSLMAQSSHNSLLVTDLYRTSILEAPQIARLLRDKTESEGSTQGLLFVEKMRYSKEESAVMVLELPPMVVPDLMKMLKGRIYYQRDFFLVNSVTDSIVNFSPPKDDSKFHNLQTNVNNSPCSWRIEPENQQLSVTVSVDFALQLQETLRSQEGDYVFPALPNFVLRIVHMAQWDTT
jgi:hypothetical protein